MFCLSVNCTSFLSIDNSQRHINVASTLAPSSSKRQAGKRPRSTTTTMSCKAFPPHILDLYANKTSAIKIEEDPSFQNNSSCADEKELESTFNTISPIHFKLHTSARNVVNITKATWQKAGHFYSLCKKPSTPIICFVLGYMEKNYLRPGLFQPV